MFGAGDDLEGQEDDSQIPLSVLGTLLWPVHRLRWGQPSLALYDHIFPPEAGYLPYYCGVALGHLFGGGLFSQTVWGSVVDRFGRKLAMVVGLFNEIMVWMGLALLGSLEAYAVLMALSGLMQPASRIGSHAMVADLVEADKRAGAYALLRMSSNAGVAIGPAMGGFLAAISYLLSFATAAATAGVVLLLTIFLVRETRPELRESKKAYRPAGGYGYILRDLHFLAFCGACILLLMAY